MSLRWTEEPVGVTRREGEARPTAAGIGRGAGAAIADGFVSPGPANGRRSVRPEPVSPHGRSWPSDAAVVTGPRVALMAVLVAAAVPVRVSAPVIGSVSILDVVLVALAATLLFDWAFRPIDPGYRQLFWILCVPLVVSGASLVWSQDRPATLHSVFVSLEGLAAYLVVVRELRGVSAARVITYMRRFVYLVILPAILLLLSVPGFAPQVGDLSETSGDYISYFTRLSHPFLGRSNNLATVLAFFAPLLVYWGHTRRNRRATVAGVAAFAAIFLTQSRSALLAFVVAAIVCAPLVAARSRSTGLTRKIVAIVLIGILAVGVLYSLNPSTNEFFSGRFTRDNVDSRTALISTSLERIAERPFLGYGGGVTPDYQSVHNTFLQQIVYFGLPLGLLVSAALVGMAAFILARRAHGPFAVALGYVVVVQLVIFLFQASFEGTVLRVVFFMSMGLGVAFLRATEAEGSEPERPSAGSGPEPLSVGTAASPAPSLTARG